MRYIGTSIERIGKETQSWDCVNCKRRMTKKNVKFLKKNANCPNCSGSLFNITVYKGGEWWISYFKELSKTLKPNEYDSILLENVKGYIYSKLLGGLN